MSSTVTASNGKALPLDDLPLTLTFDGAFIETITTIYDGITYVQTYTNDGTNITGISPFIDQ
jgi:hypothetical protein